MSAALALQVARLSQSALALQATQLIVQQVARPVEQASASDIQLRVTESTEDFGDAQGPLSMDRLHRCLEQATGFQRGRDKVERIGLLVADAYEPRPDFFGLMFDADFSPSFGNPWATTPREGCAVFVGGIESRRSANKARLDEVLYTAIHELAHVFNIQHSEPPSYMAQSADRSQPFDLETCRFNRLECDLLAQCSTSRHIWPGGSAFGDLGLLASANAPVPAADADPLRLEIGISQSSFWAFEPVELDVSLRSAANAQGRSAVRDMLDPGYREFRIWIEEPDGRRRFYRAPKHFCRTRRRITLQPEDSLTRDITLFGESGAYTFRVAGVHRVWASFAVSPHRTLESNRLEVEVRPLRTGDSYCAAAADLLCRPAVARLLFHRELGRSRRNWLGALSDFCSAFPRQPGTAMVRYGMGRALARCAEALNVVGHGSASTTRQARAHLRAAAKRAQLGDYRRWRAERCLDAMG